MEEPSESLREAKPVSAKSVGITSPDNRCSSLFNSSIRSCCLKIFSWISINWLTSVAISPMFFVLSNITIEVFVVVFSTIILLLGHLDRYINTEEDKSLE